MTRLVFVLAAPLLSGACALATSAPTPLSADRGPQLAQSDANKRSLKSFESLDQLRQAMVPVADARRIAREKELATFSLAETVTVVAATPSITNNQQAGVDEGDIVKRQGDLLIVLRRGRLFTIGIGGRQLDSLAVADAFGPGLDGIEPNGSWYDELLVHEHTIIVIGYSYERGGTEIGLFDLGDHGELQHRATYHLRSDDYYSGRNYASRLIDERLVLFSSLRLPENVDPNTWLPALRRWDSRGSKAPFENITSINRVFRPVAALGADPTIHTLTICNVAAPSFTCEATVVLGDDLAVYYASSTAAYAWTTPRAEDDAPSILYRMPFDGAPVSAIGVRGTPPDQLAFFETAEDLNVVAAQSSGVVTLLRLPLFSFADGSIEAPRSSYRPLAHIDYDVVARFVGSSVLVGTPTLDPDEQTAGTLIVTDIEGTSTVSVKLTHGVERIEVMGTHAVVVGSDANDGLSMTAIRLGKRASAAGTLALSSTSQAEWRSHAFFYRQSSADDGVFGLPIEVKATSEREDPSERPVRILFIQNRGLTFTPKGTLDPSDTGSIDDDCHASCVDWYGNARPIFVDGRIFALIGYEIVEGHLAGDHMNGVRRLDFTPRAHVR